MKKIKSKFQAFGALAMLSLAMIACQKDLTTEIAPESSELNAQTSQLLKASVYELPGRALAANCFQCHGTNGEAGELKIAGIGATELTGKFNSMKTKSPGENIMNVHALGYTPEEIKLIGDYFSKQ